MNAGVVVVAVTLVLLSSAAAEPPYCTRIRAAVAAYGYSQVEAHAVAAGYSQGRISKIKRACSL